MNRFHCDKEAEITGALRGGTLHAELTKHAAGCAICADTLLVSQFLLATGGLPRQDCGSYSREATLNRLSPPFPSMSFGQPAP